MKKNKLQLILSILFIFIICLATLPLCMGCEEEDIVEVEEGQSGWIWGEDVVFMGSFIGAILAADKEIKEKKVGQDTVEDEINLRIQFLQAIMVSNNVQNISKAGEKILSAEADKTIELSADDTENQNSENQNASETTAVQAQEATQTTEKKKPTGTITLALAIKDFPGVGEIIIDFDKRTVSGSFSVEDAGSAYFASFNGTVDIETNKITADGNSEWTGVVATYYDQPSGWIKLEGVISSDYKSAEGLYSNYEGNRWIWRGTVK